MPPPQQSPPEPSAPQQPPSNPNKIKLVLKSPPQQSEPAAGMATEPAAGMATEPAAGMATEPAVDRKTDFKGGMLVLTDKDLTLYSHDGVEIIKTIPIDKIVSCENNGIGRMKTKALSMGTGGRIKRRLIVNRGTNIEENFANYMSELKANISITRQALNSNPEQYHKKRFHRGLLSKRPDQAAIANFRSINLNRMASKFKRLESDPKFRKKTKLQQATSIKETFTLPESVENPDEEYNIWIHAINRRIEGISKLRVNTTPPDAVVVIDDEPYDVSPCVIDKPLTDESASRGQYKVKAFLEGYKPSTIMVTANPTAGSEVIQLTLERMATPNDAANERIGLMREKIPQRTINYNPEEVEMEAVGKAYKLLVAPDALYMVNLKYNHVFFQVPYKGIKDISLKKNKYKPFGKKAHGLEMTYEAEGFPVFKENFVIDSEAYSGKHEVGHRYDSLYNTISKKLRRPG